MHRQPVSGKQGARESRVWRAPCLLSGSRSESSYSSEAETERRRQGRDGDVAALGAPALPSRAACSKYHRPVGPHFRT